MTKTSNPKETSKDDAREESEWKPYPQSDEPWKQNAQNTTDPSSADTPKPDLEKWAKTKTH